MSKSTNPPELVCADLVSLEDGRPRLRGSRCADCGEHYFPAAIHCTRCLSVRMESCDLGAEGSLWSWTVQEFLPKPPYDSGETPETFRPYGVGYVQMPCGIKVEARLTLADPASLAIGMPMRLTLVPYRSVEDGRQVFTFAFEPGPVTQSEQRHGR